MVENVRASIRLALFFFISLCGTVAIGTGNFIFGAFNSHWKVRWKNKVIYFWAVSIAKIIALKITVTGTPPKPPFFMVANHLSYIDVLLFWQYVDTNFVAKSEIKSWPFFGWATKTLGVLFINRDSRKDIPRMNQRIGASITGDQGLILFPEGTSSGGAGVLPFKASLLQYPASKNMPVYHAAISYASEGSTYLDICWWGDMPFFSHFWNLLKIKQFKATIIFGDTTPSSSDRKKLARRLHHCVSDNFISIPRQ